LPLKGSYAKAKKPLSQIKFNLNSDNGFCFVNIADVDFLVEMGRSG